MDLNIIRPIISYIPAYLLNLFINIFNVLFSVIDFLNNHIIINSSML